MAADNLPAPWSVPREWPGERCFILCSGPSLGGQLTVIPKLKGRVIAVKHGVLARPDADVLFLNGESNNVIARELIPLYRGPRIIIRSKWDSTLAQWDVKRVLRTKEHKGLCEMRNHVSGFDAGTSAINIAAHYGATEIIMLGYDMSGGHFCEHPLQNPPKDHFTRHMACLDDIAADAKTKGIRIVNCSPTTAVTAFERQPLEAFL